MKAQIWKIYRNNVINGCLAPARGKGDGIGTMTAKDLRFLLEISAETVYNSVKTKNQLTIHFKWANCMVCENIINYFFEKELMIIANVIHLIS